MYQHILFFKKFSRSFLIALLHIALLAFKGHAQPFTIGKFDTLQSEILHEKRRVLVHIPAGAKGNSIRYPVMYLLDGEYHFTKTLGIIEHLSNTPGNELCPQMIVVAILHPNREKDLVPPASGTAAASQDAFPEFLEKELIPFIDSRYPTTPFRVFAGHSLGGLRVVNTLLYQPQLFNSYIALDPSLGHVKNWIANACGAFDKSKYPGKSLYIAMGLTMPKGMDTSVIIQDTSGAARHMRCIMTFARNAEQKTGNGLDFAWKYYPDETHQSVFFKGTFDGLVANFHWFKNEKLYDIFNPAVDASASVKIISDYYEGLSKKMGYPILPPEQGTSDLISYLMYKKWYDKALAFARLNANNYPESEQAKAQLEACKWNSRKSLSSLLPSKTAKDIYRLGKKEAAKNTPEYNISEEAINTLGYELMQANKLADAELIFRLNIELYPGSYNVYDSHGECLLNLGKETEAIRAYRKSLELNPRNSNASEVLRKLEHKQN